MKANLDKDVKLPVLDIFKQALSLVYNNGWYLLKLLMPALLILVSIDLIRPELVSPDYEYLEAYNLYSPYLPYILIFLALISTVVSTLLATSIHQFTLYEPSQKPKQALRLLSKKELKYFLRVLQIIAITGIILSLVFFILSTLFRWDFAFWIIAGVTVLVSAYCVARFAIVLPETAIGKETSLTRAWSLSKGNGWRMVLTVLVIPMCSMFLLPSLLIAVFLYLDVILPTFIIVLLSYLFTLFSLINLSLSCRFLLDFYEPEEVKAV